MVIVSIHCDILRYNKFMMLRLNATIDSEAIQDHLALPESARQEVGECRQAQGDIADSQALCRTAWLSAADYIWQMQTEIRLRVESNVTETVSRQES